MLARWNTGQSVCSFEFPTDRLKVCKRLELTSHQYVKFNLINASKYSLTCNQYKIITKLLYILLLLLLLSLYNLVCVFHLTSRFRVDTFQVLCMLYVAGGLSVNITDRKV